MGTNYTTEVVLSTYDAVMFLEGGGGITSSYKKFQSGDGVETTIELATTGIKLKSLAAGLSSDSLLVVGGDNIVKKITSAVLLESLGGNFNSLEGFTQVGNTLVISGSITDYAVDLSGYDYSFAITSLESRVSNLENTSGVEKYLSAINFPSGTDVATFTVANSANQILNLSRYNYDVTINDIDSRLTVVEGAITGDGAGVTSFSLDSPSDTISLVTDTPATYNVDLSEYNYDAEIAAITVINNNHETRIDALEDSSPSSATKAFQAITYSATPTWDYATSFNKTITLTGDATLAITNAEDGDYGTIIVTASGATRNFTVPISGGGVIDGNSATQSIPSGEKWIFTFTRSGTQYFWTFGKNYA